MNSQNHKSGGRRNPRGGRRPRRNHRTPDSPRPAKKPSLWQRFLAFFSKPAQKTAGSQGRTPRPPVAVEVTSSKLYVGNLSFQAEEEDLIQLFRGVGQVQNAEIAAHRDTQRSKGFGFVTMTTVEEAKRAVVELHDREFMGRRLVVSGAKSLEREPSPRV